MPLQECVRLEEEYDVTKPGTNTDGECRQLAGEDNQCELLPPGNAGSVQLFELKHAQLLAEEQDFNVLVLLKLTRDPGEIEQCLISCNVRRFHSWQFDPTLIRASPLFTISFTFVYG